jgi:hypothetical protein
MADWYGTARSNYVKVADKEGLNKALEPFEMDVHHNMEDDTVAFFGIDQYGGWPGWCDVYNEEKDQYDEVEFDPETHIVPYLADGEVLIMMECGAEKLRYITGHASAFTKGKPSVYLSLGDIYKKAAEAFGVEAGTISIAEY